jgi:hypothetical protein
MTSAARTLIFSGFIFAIFCLVFALFLAVGMPRSSAHQCLQAPGRSMMLTTLHPIDRNGAMWICGTRLGDERQMPGFFCYRMEECEP